jgi:hypothetical protein
VVVALENLPLVEPVLMVALAVVAGGIMQGAQVTQGGIHHQKVMLVVAVCQITLRTQTLVVAAAQER